MEKIVIANLKMNFNYDEFKEYISKLNNEDLSNIDLYISPSYLFLNELKSDYKIVSQDVSSYTSGITGEISAKQLKSISIDYSLVGHMERRFNLGETEEIIREKMLRLKENDITPILCVGNDLNSSNVEDLLCSIDNCLNDLDTIDLIIAYEPYNLVNSNDMVDINKISNIYKLIKEKYNNTKVIYGGNVNQNNIFDIINIYDGVLVSRLSLDANKFINILHKL